MASTTKVQKVPVSERALLARLNRKLAKDDRKVCRSSPRDRHIQGEFYLVDVHINGVIGYDVSLENLGHELGVLKGWEELSDNIE